MIVSVDMNSMGHITVSPVSERMVRKFKGRTAYFQFESEVDSFLEGLSREKRRSVQEGWTERVRMDPWEFGQYLGITGD